MRSTHRVRLGGPLMTEAGGVTEFTIDAATIAELLRKLGEAHPELGDILARGVSVAINGTIYREAYLTEIPEGAEVFILPQLVGG